MSLLRKIKGAIVRDRLTQVSLILLCLWGLISIATEIFPALRHIEIDLPKTRLPPLWNKGDPMGWFGYDSVGASVFLQVLSGARVSLMVSVSVVSLSLLIGIPLGALAGGRGGWCDVVISRAMDILLAFPPLVLPITITALLGGGFSNMIIALTLGGWIGSAKIVRSEFMALKQREFVEAARALGAGSGRIMFVHMLPHVAAPLLVHASFSAAGVILAEAGLSFLGLGMGDEHPSWGALLSESRAYLLESPHLAIFPSLALLSLVLSLNFIAESMRVALNPQADSYR